MRENMTRLEEALADTPEWLDFIRLRLAADYLLRSAGSEVSETPWPDIFPDIREYLPVPPGQAAAGQWLRVPVLLVGNGQAIRQHLILGRIPGHGQGLCLPQWAEAVLADTARQALMDAFDAASALIPVRPDDTFFVIPLTLPRAEVRWQGASLGLPAALGFLALMSGQPFFTAIAATGKVTPDGAICPVDGLMRKRECLATLCEQVLIYPAENGSVPCDGLTSLPVNTLRQAWALADLYSPQHLPELQRFAGMLEEPGLLADMIRSAPPEWLRWAHERGLIRPCVRALIKQPVRFARFAAHFDALVYAGRTDAADAVADLIGPEDLAQAEPHAPLTVFRWCTSQLSRCNHRGKPRDAQGWADRALRLPDRARKADMESAVTFFNHYFVSRHNRYEFDPEIPHGLRPVLQLLENSYQHYYEFGTRCLPLLGRLYGSMTQRFAFCGPTYLNRVIAYSQNARVALGQDTVPEYQQEWQRQYNYLTYAFLDAGPACADRAAQSLLACLGISSWDRLPDRAGSMTRWEHALMARFLADTDLPETSEWYYEAMCPHMDGLPEPLHPWQLWCWNMGRVAVRLGRRHEAAAWFGKSLRLCLSPAFGPTIRVMALLPLSGLHHPGDIPPDETALRAVCRAAGELCPEHFRPLTALSPDALLKTIWERPAGLFPFTFH